MGDWEQGVLFAALGVLGTVLGLIQAVSIIHRRHAPGATMAWLLLVLLLPYVGVPLYLLFGGRKHRRMAARKPKLSLPPADGTAGAPALEKVLASNGCPPACAGNRMELLGTGEDAFVRLAGLIEEAQESLFVATFILEADETGRALLELLARKAAEGVEVRLLLDAMGSLSLSYADLDPLVRAGGRTAFFMRAHRILRIDRPDLRNHRKIVVVDDRYAMLGGMNLSAEYMGPDPSTRRWTDLSLVIEGPAAADVRHVFAQDWLFAAEEALPEPPDSPCQAPGAGRVQILPSGPDMERDPFLEALLTAVCQARRRVWIATPYFVPTDGLNLALELAARRGLDLRVVLPRRSDHRLIDLSGRSHLRDLEAAGGRVFRYLPTMMHAKAYVFDDDTAFVGSANCDVRSLFLNYEIMAVLYHRPHVREVAAWIEGLFARCEEGLRPPTRRRRWVESVARILSPLT